MIREYDCWFQDRRLSDRAVAGLGVVPAAVAAEQGGIVAAQAVEEFRRGAARLFGFSPAVYTAPLSGARETARIAAGAGVVPQVYLGTCAWVGAALGADAAAKVPGVDGFAIAVTRGRVVVAGQSEAGLLYGVFRLLALLSMERVTSGFSLVETPAVPLRMINHWDMIDGSVGRGYAGKSLFFADGELVFDRERITDYARLLASVGINCLSINNVNVKGRANLLITKEMLGRVSELAALFRPFGIRLLLSVNFAAPFTLGELDTADPLEPAVAAWWKERAALVYRYIPDLAGFLVKADSEGEPGPFQYNRTHVDGANMLAKAVKPHGGEVIWRCFVYNCTQDWRDLVTDRARSSYDHFKPLDGMFDDNVILQIKFGPYDFQVREPVSPLFGALAKTRHVMELQITQEYTGHQIDLSYLPWIWEDIMGFDTGYNQSGKGSRIRDLAGPRGAGAAGAPIEGFAAVVNTGLDNNWTGHTLAQANLYGYGRVIWQPGLGAREIADEWSALSFGPGSVADAVGGILMASYPAMEKYSAPFGVCFMVTPGLHYGPNIEGYEFSRWGTYHRADAHAIGIDRTPKGTGYTGQYSPSNAAMFADPAKCPENLVLFFHRLEYGFIMKNGETLLQNIYDTHFEGYDEVNAMVEAWKRLKGSLADDVFRSVMNRFERHLKNAREWRDQINTYFWRKTGIADKKGRKIYE